MENGVIKIEDSVGSVRIGDEVVSMIAGMAATEIKGIAGMSGGIVEGIAELLGRNYLSKGVKVEVGETEARVDLYIIVKYGERIPEVAISVQENVKNKIEEFTGLSVVEVNVYVQGIDFGDDDKKEDDRRAVR